MSVDDTLMCSFQILKPAEKRQRLTQAREGKNNTLPAILSPYFILIFISESPSHAHTNVRLQSPE